MNGDDERRTTERVSATGRLRARISRLVTMRFYGGETTNVAAVSTPKPVHP